MLRGPQTLGELKQRSERLHAFASTADVDRTLHELEGRELVARLARRPGQKEERWTHLLGDAEAPQAAPDPVEERLRRLEQRVAALEDRLEERA
jgi:uncharacterized protein YceH (UPF0502 family)